MTAVATVEQLADMKLSFERALNAQPMFKKFFLNILRLTERSKIRFGFIFYVIRDKELPAKFTPNKNKREIGEGLKDLCSQLRQSFPEQMKALVEQVEKYLEYGYNKMARLMMGEPVEQLI